jgi:hypothetical protein
METFLAANPEAEAWRREAQALDLALHAYAVPDLNIADRVLASVPRSLLERGLDWLLPAEPVLWWRPAVAAALPLVLGVAIGLADVAVGGATNSDWTTQEQALLATGIGSAWYE